MHPAWTLRSTFQERKDNLTLCRVQYTFDGSKAALCVSPQPNSAAIGPSSRLASPTEHLKHESRQEVT